LANRLFKGQKQFRVVTIEECLSCKLKMKRPFKVNDYVYKEGEVCQKCGTKMIISAIYKEELKY